MLATVTHILPLTSIRRMRVLPVPGKVLVRPGAVVSAADVIAQASMPAGHMVLDIRRALGIPRANEADRCIVRQPGEKIEKGDTIAETGGMFARIMRAPAAGEVVSTGNGQVLLRTDTRLVAIYAGFSGTVVDIIPEMGAIIETSGALIQGVWGNRQVDSGLLLTVAKTPDETLTRPAIDVSMRGAVVLAGHCSDPDALRAGSELPLRGLILASMTADLIPYASSLSYPIIVIEGFGRIPMNEAAFQLLTTSEKREISVNTVYHFESGERPELVIPLQAQGQPPADTTYFSPGQKVRIQGMPYTGMIGKILQVLPGLVDMPSGLRTMAAEVQLDRDTRVQVPLANLEVLV